MENVNSTQPDKLMALLIKRVEVNLAELTERHLTVLRESIFSNRAELRPSTLKSIAMEEAEALLNFLKQTNFSPLERGEKFHVAGFNAGAILRLNQVTRQFLLHQLENHQIAPMLEIVDTYQRMIIEGFVQSIDKANLVELERVRNILQHSDT